MPKKLLKRYLSLAKESCVSNSVHIFYLLFCPHVPLCRRVAQTQLQRVARKCILKLSGRKQTSQKGDRRNLPRLQFTSLDTWPPPSSHSLTPSHSVYLSNDFAKYAQKWQTAMPQYAAPKWTRTGSANSAQLRRSRIQVELAGGEDEKERDADWTQKKLAPIKWERETDRAALKS